MTVFFDQRGDGVSPGTAACLRRRAGVLLNLCGRGEDELSLLLTDDPAIRELNRRYRNKDIPTNVLAFAQHDAPDMVLPPEMGGRMLGDVVISYETAHREAEALGIGAEEQLTRLLIHGLLHLLGHDHELSPREAEIMFRREEELRQRVQQMETGREKMVQLAVNVDHVATLRQARGIKEPDPVLAAGICELAGAAGIVVHLREDRRHIQDRDVLLLRQTVKSKLNLEMAASREIIDFALNLKPEMVTLVPEKRKELTTEGGLDVKGQRKRLGKVVSELNQSAIPVSLFIDPEREQIASAAEVGATFVEIHTGRYCDAVNEAERDREFGLVADAAEEALNAGLRVNAGHGLDYHTTARVAALGTIEELSIGHAIMARAILVGLDRAVREMLAVISR